MLDEERTTQNEFFKFIEAKNKAFIHLCRIFIFTLIIFNAVAMFLIIYCHIALLPINVCQELTQNISWIVKSADNTLSIFICCITIFYMFDKNEIKNKVIDLMKEKFLKNDKNE